MSCFRPDVRQKLVAAPIGGLIDSFAAQVLLGFTLSLVGLTCPTKELAT
jgi:hypothetical protein